MIPFKTLKGYQREWFSSDLSAGLIVAILLVPQGIAYAFLAGMPPQAGLYAAMLPILAYAILGTSPSLAVGPVAIVSLMTMEALLPIAAPGTPLFAQHAAALALLTGGFLLVFYVIGLGKWTAFISHSVISGFSSAAAIVIILNQLKYLTALPIPRDGGNHEPLLYIAGHWQQVGLSALSIGVGSILLLKAWPHMIKRLSKQVSLPNMATEFMAKSGPLAVVVAGILVSVAIIPENLNLATVGRIPSGLPDLVLPDFARLQWQTLLPSAGLIALIGYLESLSVATAMAAGDRRKTLEPNQELLALGIANSAAALTQAYPVAGGFGRSMVNLSAGAKTQLASLITLIGVSLVVVFATDWFTELPKTSLGAIIIVAVLPLIKFSDGWHAWKFQRSDGLVWLATFLTVLATDAEHGIAMGMLISLIIYLRRTSEPHIAEVGRYGCSDHFRNIQRHHVTTCPEVLMIRIDENLYFANSRYLEDFVLQKTRANPAIKHVILIGSAINHIDFSGYECLLDIQQQLTEQSITLHLAEFKGPVMDQLEGTDLMEQLQPGKVFFTASDALKELGGL